MSDDHFIEEIRRKTARRLTVLQKEVQQPGEDCAQFNPEELLVKDDQDIDTCQELGVIQVPIPVAGQDEPEPEVRDESEEDAFAAYARFEGDE